MEPWPDRGWVLCNPHALPMLSWPSIKASDRWAVNVLDLACISWPLTLNHSWLWFPYPSSEDNTICLDDLYKAADVWLMQNKTLVFPSSSPLWISESPQGLPLIMGHFCCGRQMLSICAFTACSSIPTCIFKTLWHHDSSFLGICEFAVTECLN